MALSDFSALAKEKHTKEELATALTVLKTFKKCESTEEWYEMPFMAWTILELYYNSLKELVEGE